MTASFDGALMRVAPPRDVHEAPRVEAPRRSAWRVWLSLPERALYGWRRWYREVVRVLLACYAAALLLCSVPDPDLA